MEIVRINNKQFFDTIENLQYQNQDIREAMDFGYKDVQDAYKHAELPWARFYLVKDKRKVLATILEQRDGVLFVYTTVDLPGSNIRGFVNVVKRLLNDTIKCKDVVYVMHARWHKPGMKLLKVLGFYEYKVYNHKSIWVKDNGKQN